MLGLVRGQQGDSAAARAAFSRALKIREEVFGPDSTPVAASQFDLGMIDLREGDAAGALTRFDRGLPATDGDDAPPGLRTDLLAGRGLAQLELGRRAAAIESFEHALAVAGEGGVDPSSASVAAFGLARALADDDPPRARALAEQARDGWSAVGPRGTADLQRVEAWLGAHPQAPQAPTP
jgi:tetratricopeptide (TPR) repeat protein